MRSSPESQREDARNRTGDAPLHGMLELAPILYWEADQNFRFTVLAGMALRSMGIAPERYLGKPVCELFSSGDIGRAHQAAAAGHASTFDLDLHGRELHATVRPWLGPGGAIGGVAGIAIDLTERRFAERALRLSEHGYRTLIEEAPYAICRCTMGGELLQVNRAMHEMLGYNDESAPELLLLDLPQIFTPSDSFEAFRASLVDGARLGGVDYAWRRRDGAEIKVRVTGRILHDSSGSAAYLDIFAEDVTEKKRLETELSDAQRMQAIGQLAGGVAHDFNNLLTVIGGQVELLLLDAHDGQTRERLDEVKHAAEKAADLTRQLLAFGRRQVLRSRVININKVIGRLMGMMARLIRENVDVQFLPGDGVATVKADPSEIERVLLNLAVNAQDAMPSGGSLVIETSNAEIDAMAAVGDAPRPGHYVLITVRDTGVGMDRETRARAFEPFFTTKPAGVGTGLGLAVAYGVVRQSGGYISLESELGAGTTFRIYLPAAGVETAAGTQTGTQLGLVRGGDETILFAEDDQAIRTLISRVLEKLGYRVLTAPDGAAALELAHRHAGRIHLLLSDIIMPSLGGHELATQLKAEKPDLKIVFISGYPGHRLATIELEAGGICFLQKPVPMDVLANTIRGVLDGDLP